MNGFLSVFKREMKSYFTTPLAPLFIVIFVAASNCFGLNNDFFAANHASLNMYFRLVPWLLLVLVPAVAMRLWAEERHSNSIELLFSLPITTPQAVLGKFLAAWFVLIVAILLTLPMVITIGHLGDPDRGPIICGYLGCILLAGCFLAIGSFFSACVRNQVIAFVLAAVGAGAFYLAGSTTVLSFVSAYLPTKVIDVVEFMSFQLRFEALQRGVIEFRDLAFFVILIIGCIVANMVVLEERKAA